MSQYKLCVLRLLKTVGASVLYDMHSASQHKLTSVGVPIGAVSNTIGVVRAKLITQKVFPAVQTRKEGKISGD